MNFNDIKNNIKEYAMHAVIMLMWLAAGYMLGRGDVLAAVLDMALALACDYFNNSGNSSASTTTANGLD